ncbi:hypothetical protein BX616_000981 [Lobosporangium transversale]|uniref:F-box domain-containing protein n=1 Tax=Lobosporangium transversale TaxID=64571 RepID=A0A1Y2GY26_9FUNG|nr:hypothetical protein BCR41DRAFT_347745 [Lobosporangium transversale]KAF9917445.1 hypothetical protein BX616_000981 [Lobosporangium transversale]ORZ26671.1 hypothetical protein BCR41DRAFT_347745 [Lobosporangium transversale]|eukprot:XP_021884434.1 hypothetical protein BCR41DRAFT_347745 [Lobosporangium transversale]
MDRSEVRTLVCKALDIDSMIACSQVSRAWSMDFTKRIWRDINLQTHPAFKELDPSIIAKHGHNIRMIKSIEKQSHLDLFRDNSICHLEDLTIQLKPTTRFFSQAFDLIHRNAGTLLVLELNGDIDSDRTAITRIDALVPTDANTTSKLKKLRIKKLSMSREIFSECLSYVPNLQNLRIRECSFTGDGGKDKNFFKHQNVHSLFSSTKQVMDPNILPGDNREERTKVTSLLVHFPKLKTWDTWHPGNRISDSEAKTIKDEIRRYSPLLKEFLINDCSTDNTEGIANLMLSEPEMICVEIRSIAPSIIKSIILHCQSLVEIRTYDPSLPADWNYRLNTVTEVGDQSPNKWMFHVLLSKCPHLTYVILPAHEMELEYAKQFPWACNGLQDLRVRIRGLDTKELIVAVIKKWARRSYARRRARARQEALLSENSRKAVAAAISTVAVVATTRKEEKAELVANKNVTASSTSKELEPSEKDVGADVTESTLLKISVCEQEQEIRNGYAEGEKAEQSARSTNTLENIEGAAAAALLVSDKGSDDDDGDSHENPLVEMVVNHLLKFEHLKKIWLGYKVWTL